MTVSDNGAVITTSGYSDYGAGSDTSNGGTGSVVDSGTNISLSGMGSIFGAVGSALRGTADVIRALNPVQNTSAGALVYNPSTGSYVSAAGIQAQGVGASFTPLLWLAGLGIAAYLIFHHS